MNTDKNCDESQLDESSDMLEERKINFNKVSFLLSAAKLGQLPLDSGVEVAFVGRSNAGKSSSLNTLTNKKNLAKVSKTPGRTQLINIFELEEENGSRLIDLPGYGYAKVPDKVKQDWSKLLDSYLRERKCLKGLVIVMDIRRPLQKMDWQFLEWTQDCNLSTHILLTKADKLKFGQRKTTLLTVKKEIKKLTNEVSVQVFSSEDRTGLEELENKLFDWFT